MIDGIYSIRFRGAADWGLGLIIFNKGALTGADSGGVIYDGTYVEGGEVVTIELVMTIPPGASLVQGVPPRPVQYSIHSAFTLPVAALAGSIPVLIQMPPGPVNVIFALLRSLPN